MLRWLKAQLFPAPISFRVEEAKLTLKDNKESYMAVLRFSIDPILLRRLPKFEKFELYNRFVDSPISCKDLLANHLNMIIRADLQELFTDLEFLQYRLDTLNDALQMGGPASIKEWTLEPVETE